MSSRCRCSRPCISRHSGPGRPVPTGRPSTRRDGQYAASGGGDPQFVAGAELAHLDRPRRDRKPAPREFEHGVARGAGQDAVIVGRRRQRPASAQEHAARGALEQQPVAHQQRLVGAAVGGLLAQQHVGEQRHRLDVAAGPADVLECDRGESRLEYARGGHGKRAREGEHGRHDIGGEQVVAAVLGAARHLQVEQHLGAACSRGDPCEDAGPLGGRVRVRQADGREAARESLEVLAQAERAAAMHGHHLVHAVGEQEAAVQRRDPRLGERHQPAVEVAGRIRLRHVS